MPELKSVVTALILAALSGSRGLAEPSSQPSESTSQPSGDASGEITPVSRDGVVAVRGNVKVQGLIFIRPSYPMTLKRLMISAGAPEKDEATITYYDPASTRPTKTYSLRQIMKAKDGEENKIMVQPKSTFIVVAKPRPDGEPATLPSGPTTSP